jgi:hypothetical protein
MPYIIKRFLPFIAYARLLNVFYQEKPMQTARYAALLLALTLLTACSNTSADWDKNYSVMLDNSTMLPLED